MRPTPRRARALATLPPPVLTGADVARVQALGLTVMSYQDLVVDGGDGRRYWLPRDLVGADGRTVILWRTADQPSYAFDGWEPWHAGLHGGRRATLAEALRWLEVARDVRAGLIRDFTGT